MKSVLLASYQIYMVDAFNNAVRKKFPEALCFNFSITDGNDLRYDTVIENALNKQIKDFLDPAAIKNPQVFFLALKMLDRNEPFRYGLTIKSRQAILTKVYYFLEEYVTNKSIELVFFEEEPHQFFDYMLYLVALENNIEVAWFERSLPQSGLLLKRYGKYLKVDVKNAGKNVLSLKEYANKMLGDYRDVASLMYFDAEDTLRRLENEFD